MHWTCEESCQIQREEGEMTISNTFITYWNKLFIPNKVFFKPYQHEFFLSMQIAKLKQPKIHPQLNYIM
jgi:hypothetical protein